MSVARTIGSASSAIWGISGIGVDSVDSVPSAGLAAPTSARIIGSTLVEQATGATLAGSIFVALFLFVIVSRLVRFIGVVEGFLVDDFLAIVRRLVVLGLGLDDTLLREVDLY